MRWSDRIAGARQLFARRLQAAEDVNFVPPMNNKTPYVRFSLALALLLALAPAHPSRAETLTVGGTGTSAPLVERLAHAYSKLKPDVTVRVVSPPMGSNGAIRAALAGAIDLAVAGRPLTDAERAQGGQDRELGRTALAFVTSKAPAPPGWSVDDLASIYAGKVTHWADGSPIRIVMRSQGESDTATLRSLSPAMNAAVDAAYTWPGMLIAANDLDNIAMLEKTPGSLGMSSLSLRLQGGPLHPIALQGKLPSLAAVRAGDYPHLKVLYLVRGARLSETGRGFLEFIFSAAGAVVVERSGYLPARAGHPR